MNFLSVKYFLALTRAGTFTRAAEELHVTQQTLSAHIAALEKETGGALFVRKTPVELTDAGEVFYRHALVFEEEEMALRRGLADAHRNQTGVLRVAIAPARGFVMMPPVIEAFSRKHPGITVALTEGANAVLFAKLTARDVDLAIGRFDRDYPGVTTEPFYREAVALVISEGLSRELFGKTAPAVLKQFRRDKIEGLKAFRDCPFLLNSEADIAGAVARDAFRRAGFEPRVRLTTGNLATMLRLACLGTGACFAPTFLAEKLLTAGERKGMHMLPLGPGSRFTISFAYASGGPRWSMISEFIAAARNMSGEKP